MPALSNGQSLVMTATFTATGNLPYGQILAPILGSLLIRSKYARIYASDVNKTNGASTDYVVNRQHHPGIAGLLPKVQEIYSSSNWVYIRSSGLGSHVMGPWYLNAAHTQAFPNYPTNQHALYRLSRQPSGGHHQDRQQWRYQSSYFRGWCGDVQ